jgi:putative ABC transport system substrate-binding protein
MAQLFLTARHVSMKRREILSLVGGTVVAWPWVARGQQPVLPVIGFLHAGAPEGNARRLAAYRKGLADTGFVEGQSVAIEYRWAAGANDTLPRLAAGLIERQVAVIATPGATAAAVVAKAATATIPIVFGVGSDPVALGLVASLARPGGNATGVTSENTELAAKRLGLAHELLPDVIRYFGLVNAASPQTAALTADLQGAAQRLGISIDVLAAGTDAELVAAFERVPREPGAAVIVAPDAFFYIRRREIAALAARRGVPTVCDGPEYVEAGALMGYGADWMSIMEIAGNYTGRILKGERPADLPVARASKFDLVVNLKTASALGVTVPAALLAAADRVIE